MSSIRNKRIVLTGALKPERFSDLGASFNIGLALGAMCLMENGVLTAMNGRVFSWENVIRDPKSGRFQIKKNKGGNS